MNNIVRISLLTVIMASFFTPTVMYSQSTGGVITSEENSEADYRAFNESIYKKIFNNELRAHEFIKKCLVEASYFSLFFSELIGETEFLNNDFKEYGMHSFADFECACALLKAYYHQSVYTHIPAVKYSLYLGGNPTPVKIPAITSDEELIEYIKDIIEDNHFLALTPRPINQTVAAYPVTQERLIFEYVILLMGLSSLERDLYFVNEKYIPHTILDYTLVNSAEKLAEISILGDKIIKVINYFYTLSRQELVELIQRLYKEMIDSVEDLEFVLE